MQIPVVAALPFPLAFDEEPETATVVEGGGLAMRAGPLTDLFVDPAGGDPVVNAPRLLGTPTGDFTFAARVEVEFSADFDAGVLAVYSSPTCWAKLCFEFSPQREAMVVSVVTDGLSDDANAMVVDGSTVWLRISRSGGTFAFHSSVDGARWSFVRHFALGATGPVQVGFIAQSPRGDGVLATFSDITWTTQPALDLRDGS